MSVENDTLIAKFMGKECFTKFGNVYIITSTEHTPCAKYRDSWDWLMPVVDKIEATDNYYIIHSTFFSKCTVSIKAEWSRSFKVITVPVTNGRLEATYKAVVEFIKWYNKQQ